MTSPAEVPEVDVAADNDVVLKATCFGLASSFWRTKRVGVLGAARYVLAKRVHRVGLMREVADAQDDLDIFFASASVLEPTDDERQLAASLEAEAQRRGLEVDVGESQLCAMVARRGISELDTGDKRAISGLEHLLDDFDDLDGLCGRIRCLEQLVAELLSAGMTAHDISQAVCSEPKLDKTLSIIFSCYSDASTDDATVNGALDQYIESLRGEAPRLMATGAA